MKKNHLKLAVTTFSIGVIFFVAVGGIVRLIKSNNGRTQTFTAKDFVPPVTDEFVKSKSFSIEDLDGMAASTNANGTPAGTWAATLIASTVEANLFSDPATGKKYRVKNGVIVEETNLYAGMPPEVVARISQSRLNYYQQKLESDRQDKFLSEIQRANDIAEKDSLTLSEIELNQRKAMRQQQLSDYKSELNAISSQYPTQPQSQPWILRYNSFQKEWQYAPPTAVLKYNGLQNRWEFVPQ